MYHWTETHSSQLSRGKKTSVTTYRRALCWSYLWKCLHCNCGRPAASTQWLLLEFLQDVNEGAWNNFTPTSTDPYLRETGFSEVRQLSSIWHLAVLESTEAWYISWQVSIFVLLFKCFHFLFYHSVWILYTHTHTSKTFSVVLTFWSFHTAENILQKTCFGSITAQLANMNNSMLKTHFWQENNYPF